MVLLAHGERFLEAFGAEIRGADSPHLACLGEPVVGAERVRQRCFRVIGVRLVQVDMVGLQALERILDGALYVSGREALFVRRHLHAHLGGDDNLVALAAFLQPFADEGFRFAALVAGDPARIHVGRVDEIEAFVHETVEQAH